MVSDGDDETGAFKAGLDCYAGSGSCVGQGVGDKFADGSGDRPEVDGCAEPIGRGHVNPGCPSPEGRGSILSRTVQGGGNVAVDGNDVGGRLEVDKLGDGLGEVSEFLGGPPHDVKTALSPIRHLLARILQDFCVP